MPSYAVFDRAGAVRVARAAAAAPVRFCCRAATTPHRYALNVERLGSYRQAVIRHHMVGMY
eukprot:6211149-Pleurochrysis_carterae.AAC.3